MRRWPKRRRPAPPSAYVEFRNCMVQGTLAGSTATPAGGEIRIIVVGCHVVQSDAGSYRVESVRPGADPVPHPDTPQYRGIKAVDDDDLRARAESVRRAEERRQQ